MRVRRAKAISGRAATKRDGESEVYDSLACSARPGKRMQNLQERERERSTTVALLHVYCGPRKAAKIHSRGLTRRASPPELCNE